MDRTAVEARLGALLTVEDDWFQLRTVGEGRYTLMASGGGPVEIILSEHWLELHSEAAPEAADRLAPPDGTLVRRRTDEGGEAKLVRRIYYDGFTVHGLMVTAERASSGGASGSRTATPAAVIALPPPLVEPPREVEAVAVETAGISTAALPDRAPSPVREPDSAPARTTTPMPPALEPARAGDREGSTATCPQCGAGILPSDRFCLSCGRPLAGAAPPAGPEWASRPDSPAASAPPPAVMPTPVAPPAAAISCAGCGTPNPPEYRFCQGCGRVLRAAPPVVEPAAARMVTTRCPNCSYINAAANRFCQGCGTRLSS